MLKLKNHQLILLSLLLILSFPSTKISQEDKNKKQQMAGTPVLWREPADIENRNLLLGAGGEALKPDLSRVTFVEVQKGGHSTKYRVRDGAGNEWVAKIGKEAQSETAAN